MAFSTQEEHTPSYEVLTLETAKKHLKFDEPSEEHEEDELVQLYIDAAISQAENYINTEIVEKKFKVVGCSFDDVLNFTRQRIKTIDSIKYKDASGDEQTLDSSLYDLKQIDKFEYRLRYLGDLPAVLSNSNRAVEVTFILGFKRLTKAIVSAILLFVADMYEVRSDRPRTQNTSAFNLLKPYRYYPNE